MIQTQTNSLTDQLCSLVKQHGIDKVRTALDKIDCVFTEPEWAIVRSPDLWVSSDGMFYWNTSKGGRVSAEAELEYNNNGKPYLEVDNFTYWLHNQVYLAFVDRYDSNEFTVVPKDGDPTNCRVENLELVKRPWMFRKPTSN